MNTLTIKTSNKCVAFDVDISHVILSQYYQLLISPHEP